MLLLLALLFLFPEIYFAESSLKDDDEEDDDEEESELLSLELREDDDEEYEEEANESLSSSKRCITGRAEAEAAVNFLLSLLDLVIFLSNNSMP